MHDAHHGHRRKKYPYSEEPDEILESRVAELKGRYTDKEKESLRTVQFEAGGHVWAIASSSIRRVLPASAVVRIPLAPDYVRGIINIRGSLELVLDINVLLELSENVTEATGQILLLDHPFFAVALQADGEVVSIHHPLSSIMPIPQHLPKVIRNVLDGIIIRDGKNIGLLNISKLLTLERFSEFKSNSLQQEEA
ncbi:MAG: hypothetical protein GXO82_00275 [Chlorobi bacterium]|nr:hypothetical protein [Chlorobiota bacterium]